MQYTRFRKYSNFSKGSSKISVAAFVKLFLLYVILIGMIFSLLLCTYKIYTDSWYKEFATKNFLLQEIVDGIPQNDSRIVEFIREYHMRGPSEQSYNWSRSANSGYNAVNTLVRALLGKLENGIFIEANAGDGETRSNTKVLETNHGWRGVLIEPSASTFQRLVNTKRKSTLINSCLSTSQHPSVQQFFQPFNYSISEPQRSLSRRSSVVKFTCFPLYSIMTAANIFQVDYLSLDVNGKELQVLETLPFESISIKTISASYTQIPEGGDILRDFLASKGYKLVGEAGNQFIFLKQNRSMNSAYDNDRIRAEGSYVTDDEDEGGSSLNSVDVESGYRSKSTTNVQDESDSSKNGLGVEEEGIGDALSLESSSARLDSESLEDEEEMEGFDMFSTANLPLGPDDDHEEENKESSRSSL